MQIGAHVLPNALFVAPMAGVTDRPFRKLCKRLGAGYAVSEMVTSRRELWDSLKTSRRANHEGESAPIAVQIAGTDPQSMADAARYNIDRGARIIDINMGCPARKVTGGLSGAALMRDLDHALRLIEAVVEAVELPVTLKMRLGWDGDCLNAPELARRASGAGVRMLTVHGRTRAQFYKGQADWRAIRDTRQAVAGLPDAPPLVANGDITDAASARAALAQSGADAVMVGRGAQGAPWRLAQIAHELWGAPAPRIPRGPQLADAVEEHYHDILSLYGQELGLRVARKHLGWYADESAAPNRDELLRATSAAQALAAIRAGFADAGLVPS